MHDFGLDLDAVVSPHDTLQGYLRFGIEAITVCQLYYQTRKAARNGGVHAGRITAASGMGVNYLLYQPSNLVGGRSVDVFTWGEWVYGRSYFGAYCQSFSNGPNIPLEWYQHRNERQELGHRHGLETHLLLIEHKIRIIYARTDDLPSWHQQE